MEMSSFLRWYITTMIDSKIRPHMGPTTPPRTRPTACVSIAVLTSTGVAEELDGGIAAIELEVYLTPKC